MSEVSRFRTKSFIVEAIQFGPYGNAARIIDWLSGYGYQTRLDHRGLVVNDPQDPIVIVRGTWVIRKNEKFYYCKPEYFERTYENFGEPMTDLEWKEFLVNEVRRMEASHQEFVADMRRRFWFGGSVAIGMYLTLQLVVYLVLGKVSFP